MEHTNLLAQASPYRCKESSISPVLHGASLPIDGGTTFHPGARTFCMLAMRFVACVKLPWGVVCFHFQVIDSRVIDVFSKFQNDFVWFALLYIHSRGVGAFERGSGNKVARTRN